MSAQVKELHTEDRTAVYQGEISTTQKNGKSVHEMNGQGKLETFGYLDRHWDTFTGKF